MPEYQITVPVPAFRAKMTENRLVEGDTASPRYDLGQGGGAARPHAAGQGVSADLFQAGRASPVGTLPADVLAERLMLAIYAYGTNCGIRSVISGRRTGTARKTSATRGAAT